MPRPKLCKNCKAGRWCEEYSCRGAAEAYDTGHTEGHAAGVSAERQRWRATVDGACRKQYQREPADVRKSLRFYADKHLGRAERALLEILEAMEQKA